MIKTKNTVTYSILLIIGVIILINILSDKFFLRLDFTADKRYTLSKATKDILDNLIEPVTVKAYFSEDLPPDFINTRRDFKEILVEYGQRSNGMLVYEFINPNESDEIEQEAMQNGIQPIQLNVRDKDQIKVQRAYFGAVLQYGEKKEVISTIIRQSPSGQIYTIPLEYELSTKIKKLSYTNKKPIAFIQGQGGPSIKAMNQAASDLKILYNIEEVTLSDTTNELDRYETAVIIAPKDSFKSYELEQLDQFLAQGKNLLIGINRVEGNFQNAMGNSVNTGLEFWLSSKGVTVENNFVIDANSGTVTIMQQQGPFQFHSQVPFPYFPVISTFEKHPITQGLEMVYMQFVSSLTFHGDTTLKFIPIIKTSENSGTQSVPTYFNIQKNWTKSDFPLSKLTVAGILEGPIVGNLNSRIVIIGDGDFPVNGEGEQARQIQPDNVSLLVNSIDWLSDDTGLINLRTKGVTARPLDQIEDGKKTFLKYLNFLLPIIIIIIYGIVRMQINRNIRIKRMEEGYV